MGHREWGKSSGFTQPDNTRSHSLLVPFVAAYCIQTHRILSSFNRSFHVAPPLSAVGVAWEFHSYFNFLNCFCAQWGAITLLKAVCKEFAGELLKIIEKDEKALGDAVWGLHYWYILYHNIVQFLFSNFVSHLPLYYIHYQLNVWTL